MKDYKRITNTNLDEFNPRYAFCKSKSLDYLCKNSCDYQGCARKGGNCENYKQFIKMYNRLYELENKIEQQELVSLNNVAKLLNNWFDNPCVYGLHNEFVAEYMFEKYGDWCEDNCGKKTVDSPICWEMFLKAKLAELRGGK